MATESSELDAFYEFAQQKLRGAAPQPTLEEVLCEFRQQEGWVPRTPLGKRLKELRQQFISEGGKLLDAEEVADEVRQRRGKHFSEE